MRVDTHDVPALAGEDGHAEGVGEPRHLAAESAVADNARRPDARGVADQPGHVAAPYLFPLQFGAPGKRRCSDNSNANAIPATVVLCAPLAQATGTPDRAGDEWAIFPIPALVNWAQRSRGLSGGAAGWFQN